MRTKGHRIIFAGQFPPPVTGLAYITQEMAKALAHYHQLAIIDLSPHRPRSGFLYHLRRLALTIKGLGALIQNRAERKRIFYIACEGNLGLIYMLILSAAARLLRYPIYLHHHSFAYIERRSLLMSGLLRVAGPGALHIFLSAGMGQRFAARYGAPVKGVVLSNSAFIAVPPEPLSPKAGRSSLVIGLLSNLTQEKGLDTFLAVLREALVRQLDISAVLAGPAQSESDRQMIAAACREFGGRLDYRGAVYNAEKDKFFRAIDVFIFPTRYANEAQPAVLFEALAYGIPVLSYDRGCIGSQVGAGGAVIPRDVGFVSSAVEWLRAPLASSEHLAELRKRACDAFCKDREASLETLPKLFELSAIDFTLASS